ncbi:hypothetical protein K488DRAFT_83132 [Vararia minispora EC-137]|uniref:Uncharacterized protein n=1 Tax=Vararia minispora EC-137 TaxID=1314806 RepID=A0ACB8QU91_9AGAM|nr:hypothetical protein K488DRAFT_83132 [Vararia minispora EC-137]
MRASIPIFLSYLALLTEVIYGTIFLPADRASLRPLTTRLPGTLANFAAPVVTYEPSKKLSKQQKRRIMRRVNNEKRLLGPEYLEPAELKEILNYGHP